MFYLIKKDILMQKRTVKLSIIYILLFTIFISKNEPIGLTIGILSVTYMLALGSSALEDKNNSDKMLISLPIKRQIIVMSKYVSVYVFAFFAIIVCFLIYFIASLFYPSFIQPITMEGLMAAIISITLFSSVSYPLIFKYGYMKSKMANLIVFFVLVFGGSELVNYSSQNNKLTLNQNILTNFNNRTDVEILIILMVPLALILIISYFLSLTFYNKREF